MNEIPFEVIYWNKWFQLGGIVLFWLGYLFAHILPFLKPKKKEENKKGVTIGNGGVTATYDYYKRELTLTYANGKVKRYSGSSTVWFELPMMQRCSVTVEYKLCDIHRYIETWGNPYPIAHTKSNQSKV